MYTYIFKKRNYQVVKIGKSANPLKRLKGLSTGSDEKLFCLAVYEEEIFSESYLHRRFSGLRKSGEWFKYGGELREFVDINKEENVAYKIFEDSIPADGQNAILRLQDEIAGLKEDKERLREETYQLNRKIKELEHNVFNRSGFTREKVDEVEDHIKTSLTCMAGSIRAYKRSVHHLSDEQTRVCLKYITDSIWKDITSEFSRFYATCVNDYAYTPAFTRKLREITGINVDDE